MSHANARLAPRGRLELARCIVDDDWPLRRAAERFQVSPTTAKRWADRYRQVGAAGMQDRSSRPAHSPRRTPQRRERRIINLRVTRRWGPARIGFLLGLHPSTVHRVLARYGLARLRWLDRATGRVVRRYEHAAPGDLVHVDIKKLGRIPDGGGWKIHRRTVGNRNNKQSRPGYAYLHNAVELLARLLGEAVDIDGPIDALSLSQRQACCIARSLLAEPTILVLDEATSALDIATRDRLFELVHELTARGTGVVFISHRMDEVFAITDVVTVLRSGATVAARLPIADVTVAGLVTLMSGRDHRVRTERTRSSGSPVLTATGLVLRPGATPVDFEVRAGELVGLAGLEGQGQAGFLSTLHGGAVAAGTVVRNADGGATTIDTPMAARRNGIASVPRERRHAALFEQLSIRENFGLPTMGLDTVGGVLRPARTDRRLAEFGARLRLRMRHPGDPVATLSGGNQQKVVLARALADGPAVLLLDDPTRGIDQSAKQDVYDVLVALCAAGTAVVMVSSEVDELVELADRVLVFRDHTLSASIDRDHLSRADIVAAYFGLAPDDPEVAVGEKAVLSA